MYFNFVWNTIIESKHLYQPDLNINLIKDCESFDSGDIFYILPTQFLKFCLFLNQIVACLSFSVSLLNCQREGDEKNCKIWAVYSSIERGSSLKCRFWQILTLFRSKHNLCSERVQLFLKAKTFTECGWNLKLDYIHWGLYTLFTSFDWNIE